MLAAYEPLAGVPASMRRSYLVLDVFTDTPLAGNALGVVTDAAGLSGADMQSIARELNLSETVFFLEPSGAQADVRIRIFTPASELPFAGHPVLGAAVVAGGALGLRELTIETAAGAVPVSLDPAEGRARSGWMTQPLPVWREFDEAAQLLAALGGRRSTLPVVLYDNGPRHVIVTLQSQEQVGALTPDLRALGGLGEICISCVAGEGALYKNRMFAPSLGVPEDPATGSAAGPIAVHLARNGVVPFGLEIEIRQGLEVGRPSLLRAIAEGSPERLERVRVGGCAVIVAAGSLML